ncbi:NADPH-dependent FMN reductase [Rathayibacter sp. AY1G1]|jgi:FMN reductase|uniref:FMN reductase n=1 Tax=unclassified Rathayibacter TaxID=2609250 RepID=UPI000CE8C56F|nr:MULTISPECIES: FMN reductase [unclassified Rathayibacter]PPF16960.1 NADPH-dependent FMN reductase [Rathayibacter sp. AY1A4]PPF18543.1 NADPH-dependent FMN reductase [Rathayibacter sp. AY1A7]PPF31397.1 NADPH-dependent FMN reductase [Rathayibacter sp. AY1A3]PPG13000.1 NADPH-dependent FMN reductase [Rathayibacter sp. AY1C6]PPG32876.1 NADPH-dependent FMN reductase [Rathayibacter sp. AY2B9]
MDTRRITVLSAGLSQPSSTRLLADRLADAAESSLTEQGFAVERSVVELRDLAHDVTNNLLTGFASPALQTALDAVAGADGLIAVTPIFTTSYSGLFKSFVDVLDTEALRGLPVLLAATGGSPRHSLAVDYAMRPLFTYLHAAPLATTVFAATDDWGGATEDGRALPSRIERAGRELADQAARSSRSGSTPDPWALDGSFEGMLGRRG